MDNNQYIHGKSSLKKSFLKESLESLEEEGEAGAYLWDVIELKEKDPLDPPEDFNPPFKFIAGMKYSTSNEIHGNGKVSE